MRAREARVAGRPSRLHRLLAAGADRAAMVRSAAPREREPSYGADFDKRPIATALTLRA